MNKYIYNGPVFSFNTCIDNYWTAVTYAVSEKKANSNLRYQYTKYNNMIPNCKITLPGKLIKEDSNG